MRFKLATIVLVVLFQGCPLPGAASAAPAPAKTSAIIVVPGFKGTALEREDSGKRVWITTSQALFGRSSLAFNDPRLALPGALNLKTDGVLKSVTVIPGLYSRDVYGGWIAGFHKKFSANTDIIEFAYDWRRDPVETVNALGALISDLRTHGVTSIKLVTHSFGGLITAYYLRYGVQEPEAAAENWEGARQVEKVVFVGVPFLGTMVTFRDMQMGETVGLNHALLDATVHSSFPSSYFLLPAPAETVFVSPRLEPAPVDLYRAAAWREHGWGLFASGDALSAEHRDARSAVTAALLDRAATFSGLVNAPPGPPTTVLTTKVWHVVGHGRPTLAAAVWNQETNALEFTRSEGGDGVVTARSAELPPAYRSLFKTTTIESRAAHDKLWADGDLEERMRRFLADE